MTGDVLRVGLVGAGMVSQFHVAGWQVCADAELRGIADPDIGRAQARALEAGGVPFFSALAGMAADIDLDAVDIVAPPHLHGALIGEALALGLHVMCQKPLAPTASEASAIVSGLPTEPRVMVHENWRWRAPYRVLKHALQTGILDAPEKFEFRVQSSGLVPAANGTFPAIERQPFFVGLQRFLVTELLVHHLDTLAFLFGPLTVLEARLDRRCDAIIGEDFADIRLMAGGIEGRLVGDCCVPGAQPLPNDRLILDDGASADIDGWSVRLSDNDIRSFDPSESYQRSYSDTIAHFARCIRMGDGFETTPEQAVAVLETVEEIYRLGADSWSSI